MSLSTPVAFLIFNRPETTQRVFQAIASARPQTLLVVCDGARPNHPTDAAMVQRTRGIIEQVDWPCKVMTDFSEENLGCKRRITTGLDWVFRNVEEAIVLEDDCLPNASFFPFCEQLLKKYRDDPRVSAISGDNFQGGVSRTPHSYYFSKYFHCWGWATWRRAWNLYDPRMNDWSSQRSRTCLQRHCESSQERRYWNKIFASVHRGEINTWDYPFLYSCWAQDASCVIPDMNLVSNIGFGESATHTVRVTEQANLPTADMEIGALDHPSDVIRNREADEHSFRTLYQRPRGLRKIGHKLQRWLAPKNEHQSA